MLTALAVAALAPVGASAAVTTIDGSPLNIYTGDTGSLQARFDSGTTDVFFPPSDTQGDAGFFIGFTTQPSSGIAAGTTYGPPISTFSFSPYTTVSQGLPTGSPTHIQETVYKIVDGATDVMSVTQTVTYTDGQNSFRVDEQVKNLLGTAVRFRASEAADLYLDGSDIGDGLHLVGPPEFIGGVNDAGARGGLEEISPSSDWSHYEESHYSSIFTAVDGPLTAGFDDSVLPPPAVDNGAGIQWDDFTGADLATGASYTFSVVWRLVPAPLSATPKTSSRAVGKSQTITAKAVDGSGVPVSAKNVYFTRSGANAAPQEHQLTDSGGLASITWTGANPGFDTVDMFLDSNGNGIQDSGEPTAQATVDWLPPALYVSPSSGTKSVGQTAALTATAYDGEGFPIVGKGVRFTRTGANPGSGSVPTDASGNAPISWTGHAAGTDTVNLYLDLNGDHARETGEPQAQATVTWDGGTVGPAALPPPVFKQKVNLLPVSGTVLIKPRGATRFTRLTRGVQIPVGSLVDATKGRVTLTSANAQGKTQTADFYGGVFLVRQIPGNPPITDLVLQGGNFKKLCKAGKSKARKGAATTARKKKKKRRSHKVVRKLWGNGKGSFRTTGKRSASTVRGTVWLTADRCDGTFTQVKQGTVTVRDFRRRKNVTVRAGKSYLAK